MAFHDPNPKIRELEERNARLRAALFARLFRAAWHGLRRGAAWLMARRIRRDRGQGRRER